MAQSGYTPISIYYSSTASNVPSAANLVAGELAINTADGKLFYKDSGGSVQVIGTKGGVGSSTTTQVLYNSSGLVVGSANMTFDGTKLTLANDASINGLTVGKGAGASSLNTAFGVNALSSSSSNSASTAIGYGAGAANTTGEITAVGVNSLLVNTTGNNNTAIGDLSLYSNTTGSQNTAMGRDALRLNTTASYNTAVGYQAGYSNTTGSTGVFIGIQAGYTNTVGTGNIFIGNTAGYTSNYNGSANNLAIGNAAGYNLTTGIQNTFIGASGATTAAGYYITSGSKNTIIGGYTGNNGGLDIRTASNYIVLSDGDGNPRQIIDGSGNMAVYGTTISNYNNGITIGNGTTAIGYSVYMGSGQGALNFMSATSGGGRYAGAVGYDGTNNYMWFNTNSTERARIDSSGNLLVNTTSAYNTGKLNAQGGAYSAIGCQSTNSTWPTLFVWNTGTAATSYLVEFSCGATQNTIGRITSNGSSTAYVTSSDYRLKENVAPMTGALDAVAQLKPVTYTWKESGKESQGFIAHELQAVVPEAVTGEKDGLKEDGTPDYQGIDTSFLVATLTAAIQEQQAIIQSLTARLDKAGL